MAVAEDVCRICFYTEDLMYIFDEVDDVPISVKVMSIANVQISQDDHLPKHICERCFHKVVSFIEFQTQIETSYNILQNNLRWDDKPEECLMKVEFLDDIDEMDMEICEIRSVEECQQKELAENIQTEFIENDLPSPFAQIDSIEHSERDADSELSHKNPRDRPKTKTHIKKLQRNALLFQCNMCDKKYKSDFRLKCHMREHKGKMPFQCEICSKVCSTANSLEEHERNHTGERLHECSYCKKKFAQTSVLLVHQRLHTGEHPYRCEFCMRRFATSSHLKYHLVQHTGERLHKCATCEKRFAAKHDLVQHEKIHTGRRTFTCDICSMSFVRSYHLSRHMITHSGERKFKCKLCDRSFAQNYDLKRHMRKHDKVKSSSN